MFLSKKVNSFSFESVQSLAVVIPDASAMSVFLTIFDVYLHKEIWVPLLQKRIVSNYGLRKILCDTVNGSSLTVCCKVC